MPRLAELPEFGGTPGSVEGRQNIAQFAWYGLEGGLHNVDGFTIYPRMNDPYGNDAIGAFTGHFGANVVISLIDVWVMQQTPRKVAPALWCPWLPIDLDPIPEMYLHALEGAYLPLTYSKWGHKMLTDAGFENVYIPHGIEPNVYHVIPDREAVRKFKAWLTKTEEPVHLSAIVAANKGFPTRKWFEGQLEAFGRFVRANPDLNAMLYVHSLPTQHHGGVDFGKLVADNRLDGRVIFPHPVMYQLGYPAEHLAYIYNAADVLLSASKSEGFGIPIIEAQACGTPVVVTDFSAMPELVRWGHKVEVERMELHASHSHHAIPSVEDMADKMQRLYEAWSICGGDWPMEKRIATQNAIRSEYSWDVIVEKHWKPLVARLADEAPPLTGTPFYMNGAPPQPGPIQDSVNAFVDAVNEGLAAEEPKVITDADGMTIAVNLPPNEKPRPQRRVAPLVKPEVEFDEVLARNAAEVKSMFDIGFDSKALPEPVHVNGLDAVPSNEEAGL